MYYNDLMNYNNKSNKYNKVYFKTYLNIFKYVKNSNI